MAEITRMPKLSDTMTEGVVAQWHKKVGDNVKSGELLAEIETDKATMEFESYSTGVLLHIGVEKGKAAPVDSILAIFGKQGEDISKILEEEKKKAPVAEIKEEKKSEPVVVAETKPVITEAKVVQQVQTSIVKSSNPQISNNSNGRLKASPLAKKLADEKGISINKLQGSGEGGRIIKRDIENFNGGGMMMGAQVESYTEVDVSQMRKTIAKRLAESKFTAPHFYLTIDIDMDNAIETRTTIKNNLDIKVSYNDMVIKAAAMALKEHPAVNSSWLGDRIRTNSHVHMGVAVAVEDGLLVPVVRFADTKSLSQIGAEVKEYAQKAKDKKLQPQDWEGNTFTISNLGMFGIEEFTAIINTPDSCILAVGGIRETPVVKNGVVVPGNRMKVTLSCDHRVVDGATGAAFLQTFKQFLENPVLMLGMYSI